MPISILKIAIFKSWQQLPIPKPKHWAKKNSRRSFIKTRFANFSALSTSPFYWQAFQNNRCNFKQEATPIKSLVRTIKINIALSGTGIQEYSDTQAALQGWWVKVSPAFAIIYRKTWKSKRTFGGKIFLWPVIIGEVLNRKDIDAVNYCQHLIIGIKTIAGAALIAWQSMCIVKNPMVQKF